MINPIIFYQMSQPTTLAKIFSRLFWMPVLLLLTQCNSGNDQSQKMDSGDPAALIHNNVHQLTEIIIYDVFTPPVASRIYAYTSLAAYEAIRYADSTQPSIAAKLNGFPAMPVPEPGKKINFPLAATRAFWTVALNVKIFSDTVLHRYEDSVEAAYKQRMPEEEYLSSMTFGEAVGKAILSRAAQDQYKETRGMAKDIGNETNGKWRPTPPDYFDGVEPHFRLLKPFSMDSTNQFRPLPPPEYSGDSTSKFYRMVREVYTVAKGLTKEEQTIAYYWDDNPFVVQHAGHMMFANKKITPGGHWMGITRIACEKSTADAVTSAKAYALTSIALFDAFISCWEAKYHYQYVRPVTMINAWLEPAWNPYLQTPPFPEYTSGHSSISGASSEVLTALFGDNVPFHDNSDSAYIGMTRDFPSFRAAAAEASISRLYGGIHYRLSLDTGLARGAMVAHNLLKKVNIDKK
jgi:hypothetical protein